MLFLPTWNHVFQVRLYFYETLRRWNSRNFENSEFARASDHRKSGRPILTVPTQIHHLQLFVVRIFTYKLSTCEKLPILIRCGTRLERVCWLLLRWLLLFNWWNNVSRLKLACKSVIVWRIVTAFWGKSKIGCGKDCCLLVWGAGASHATRSKVIRIIPLKLTGSSPHMFEYLFCFY